MPGGIRWRWSDEPFSYQKLCYSVPMLVFFGVLIASAFGDNWLPSSNFLGVLLVGLIAGAIYLFFLKVVWQLLPTRNRARIPYDRQEAENSKGDGKLFREFCRVIFSKN